jgi:prepilin-type processing-associated H-X9-DG protein
MITGLDPYGLTVPMWFCPTRPANLAEATSNCIARVGHQILTLTDLQAAVYYNGTPTYGVIYHDLWIPRHTSADTATTPAWPNQFNTIQNKPNTSANEDYQWPSKTTDLNATLVPILSDRTVNQGGTNLATAVEGHFYNGHITGVNALYCDGHTEAKSFRVMKWRWVGAGYYTFY